MTPLAHHIVKELTLPMKDRTFKDKGQLLPRMRDIHCFELSAVSRQLTELAQCVSNHWRPGRLAFLPAERTWIEMGRLVDSERMGFFLERRPHGWVDLTCATAVGSFWVGNFALHEAIIALGDRSTVANINADFVFVGKDPMVKQATVEARARAFLAIAFGALLLINHPRSIGRRNHPAHAGLQKRLNQTELPDKYLLLPWTEIVLQVRIPPDTAVGGEDTVLRGENAYHWVRAYLRVSTGTPVLDYWRGNPALGTVQSRYQVTPP